MRTEIASVSEDKITGSSPSMAVSSKNIILFIKIAFATMSIHDAMTIHVRWRLGISEARCKIHCRGIMGKSPHTHHPGTKERLHIHRKV